MKYLYAIMLSERIKNYAYPLMTTLFPGQNEE